MSIDDLSLAVAEEVRRVRLENELLRAENDSLRAQKDMFFIGAQKWSGLSKLIEETGELLQVAGKLMGSRGEIAHWDGSNLNDRLVEEIGDVSAAIQYLIETNKLHWPSIFDRTSKKIALYNKWHTEQADKGSRE